jgi:hypothetical protein
MAGLEADDGRMSTSANDTASPTTTDERADLIAVLATHRAFLRQTVAGITEEQARLTPTVSELCLGGIVKHVTQGEDQWVRFAVEGTSAIGAFTPESIAKHSEGFRMADGETVADVLDAYDEAARRTEEVIRTLPSLDVSHPLPEAPWFEPGARWSARRALLHVLAETAQHAGHADILRETIDGAKTMG